MERSTKLINIAQAAEYLGVSAASLRACYTRVEVSLGQTGGGVTLVVPLSSFEPVRDKLAEGLKSVTAESRQRWQKSLRAQLENAQIELSSVFLETEITMRELLQMKPGDVLPIEMPRIVSPARIRCFVMDDRAVRRTVSRMQPPESDRMDLLPSYRRKTAMSVAIQQIIARFM